MAFDGGLLHKLIDELKNAIDCHVDKIYQPSRDELVFLLRKKGFVKRLLITVKPGASRINFTDEKYENPDSPPMFCMLVRKYLSASRLIDVVQNNLERVAELIFSSTNEMGDRITLKLICELIGNQANIILLNNDGKIIDSIRRSDIETSSRLIQPGAVYKYPQSQNKLNPLTENIDTIIENIFTNQNILLSKAILNTVDGFSPLICRESAYKAYGDDINVDSVIDKERLRTVLSDIFTALKEGFKPVMVLKPDSSPLDFTYINITQYSSDYICTTFESFSELLDAFYARRENAARIHHSAQDIIKLISNLRSRTEKKLALRIEELKKCENREQLRIYGELLKSNLYAVTAGSSFAEVQNYYDENLSLIKIPLNPAITPSANAAKYFKDYKKTYTAEQTLTELTAKDKEELIYFDSVLDSISRTETLSELSEIRDELCEAGYIKQNNSKKKKKPSGSFKEYTSPEGYRIVVGKNNRQNDLITTSLASKNDLWFHTKNIPGSHVVVFCGGEDVCDETVLMAATLAASNSKASTSSNVPVDYTPIKYVKKPNGAKPGMVIYTTNKTLYVTPKEMN